MQAGEIILVRMNYSDLSKSKLRPVLIVSKAPNNYNDWLICAISSKTNKLSEKDISIGIDDIDFKSSGLKQNSVIKVSKIAIITEDLALGRLGTISDDRLLKVKSSISNWIKEN